MRLSLSSLKKTDFWQQKHYQLPQYDISTIRKNTTDNPRWVHIGAGNIFRAFLANIQQELINKGHADTGIIAVSGSTAEAFEKVYYPFDNLCLFVRLKNDRTMDKIVLGSISEALCIAPDRTQDIDRLKAVFANPSLQMVSLTVTEKGYQIKSSDGNYLPDVQHDMAHDIDTPISLMGKLTAMLHYRFLHGAAPLALVSMDNISHNGETLKHAIVCLAEHWHKHNHVDNAFVAWLQSDQVAFPWTMIDKITPRPDAGVAEMLKAGGLTDIAPQTTKRNSYIAPFVNAEELEYLVIEDTFPNGRPALDKAGVLFSDRETVNKVETMKVTTCLNPIHTGLAIFGCLLGFDSIHAEMQDNDLRNLCHTIGYREGLPVVVDPKILSPQQFIDEVINVRLPNPFIPDTPQRIATDTSQKLGIRFGETIKKYEQREDLSTDDLVAIPLVFAGWCRYLLGIDDKGTTFECSPDPRLSEAQMKLAGIQLGDQDLANVQALFSDPSIFGVNLYDVGLGEKAAGYLREMLTGKGAVRATLQKYLPKT